jgi:hypothetical protein
MTFIFKHLWRIFVGTILILLLGRLLESCGVQGNDAARLANFVAAALSALRPAGIIL